MRTKQWGVWLEKALLTVKDIIFPVFCVVCKQEGTILCAPCKNTLDSSGVFFDTPIRRCAVGFHTPRGALTALLRAYKYEGSQEAKRVIEKEVFHFCYLHPDWFEKIDIVTYVPLHPRRLAERGFNQAEVLAQAVSEGTNVPMRKVVKRIKYTKQQAQLDELEREENVAGIFVCTEPLKGKHILIVDDVYTTGATIQSCMESLYTAGADHVSVFTVLYRE